MQVREIMTCDLVCCDENTSLQEAARLMADYDCGMLPVTRRGGAPGSGGGHVLGVITDRDIACRGIAQGKSPQSPVRECMTGSVIFVKDNESLERALEQMEEHQIRRVPVVGDDGCYCGIVSQADIARCAGEHDTAELLREVSQPTHHEPRM